MKFILFQFDKKYVVKQESVYEQPWHRVLEGGRLDRANNKPEGDLDIFINSCCKECVTKNRPWSYVR
jgi:hypothetical protein